MRCLPLLAFSVVTATFVNAAQAQEQDEGVPPVIVQVPKAAPKPPPPPATPPPGWTYPPNVHVGPDGSVDVHRTPEQGVDVHAETEDGTVHAYGCSRVQLDTSHASGNPTVAPCPPPPVYPYPYPYPYAYPAPSYYPAYYYPQALPPRKPKYAPDPTRQGALIASSLVFGLGTAAAGGAYLASVSPTCDENGFVVNCPHEPSKPALWAMGGFMTVTPSLPRLVMGDVGIAILLTALRGGSFAAGAIPDWKDKSYMLPVTFAFIVPATLGIVDLATTPHREQMEKREKEQMARDANKVKVRTLSPVVAKDERGNTLTSLAAGGTF